MLFLFVTLNCNNELMKGLEPTKQANFVNYVRMRISCMCK